MIRHHPNEDTLGRFALGGLRAGAQLVVAAHLKACARCRAEVGKLEAVAGVMLGGEETAPLSSDALARTLSRLDEPAASQPDAFDLGAAVHRGMWLPAAPGLWFKPLKRYADQGERLYLLKAKGGTPLPEHGHNGCERLIVLEGAFEDESGAYGPGDLAECDEDTIHEPRAMAGPDCVCLAVTDGPLRLSGVARWLQPLLGV